MGRSHRAASLAAGAAVTVAAALVPAVMSTAPAAAATARPAKPATALAHVSLRVKQIGKLANGQPKFTSSTPTGLSPAAIQSAYSLSGLSPSSGAGAGQVIAIVDAYHDANALSDLNTFNTKYGYPALSTCTSLTQAGACFAQDYAQGSKPKANSGWALEESLDIEWAHAEAPAAKIVLVEAASNSNSNLYGAVSYANN